MVARIKLFLSVQTLLCVLWSGLVYGQANECPVNSLMCWHESDTTSVQTSEGTKEINCLPFAGAEGRIGYDLPLGAVWTAVDEGDSAWPIYTSGFAADTYWLTSAGATDSPIPFRAIVVIDITSWSSAEASAFVREGLAEDDPIHYAPADTTMIFYLNKRVGETFDLLFGVAANDLWIHRSAVRIDFFFEVPVGVTIVSCQGFQGGVVPTLPTTWGRIKAKYRN